jgi:hypothetical protein
MLETIWKMGEDIQLKALVLMWEWWGVRNKINAGEAPRSIQDVFHRIE